MESLEERVSRLENEKRQLQAQLDALKTANGTLHKDVERLTQEKDTAIGRFDILQEQHNYLDRTSKSNQIALTQLQLGVKDHLLDSNRQSLMNIPPDTEAIEALRATFMDAVVRGVLERVSNMTATSADMDTRYKDTLATMFPNSRERKTLAGFLKIVSQSFYSNDLQDLWALNQHFFSHPAKDNEPLWVWLTISHFLNNHLKYACDKKDGVRFSILLSVAAQLDQILANHQKPTYISGLSRGIDEQVLVFGRSSFIGFVTAARYFSAIDSLSTLDDDLEYHAVRSGVGGGGNFTLAQWVSRVKTDGTLHEALISEDLRTLRFNMSTYLHRALDRSSGCTFSVFWDTMTGSFFSNESVVFLEHENNDVEFSPEFFINIDPSHSFRLVFERDTDGFVVHSSSQLFNWLLTFYERQCEELITEAETNRRAKAAAEEGNDDEEI